MCFVCILWCRAFTRTERALVVLQFVLLALFIAFLIFLILHLATCDPTAPPPIAPTVTTTPSSPTADATCSWIPSHKTEATTQYYLDMTAAANKKTASSSDARDYVYELRNLENSEATCTTTALDHFWTITSAHCFDKLTIKSYVILDREGNAYDIDRVIVHPRWDVACVRAALSMPSGGVPLYADVRALLLTAGETLTAVGRTDSTSDGRHCSGVVRKVPCVSRERRHLSPARAHNTLAPRPLCVSPLPSESGCAAAAAGAPLLAGDELVAIRGAGDAHTPLLRLRAWVGRVRGQ